MNQDAGVILALFLQAAAVFYWGGQVKQTLSDHDRRIERLEDRRRFADDLNAEKGS